LVDTCFFLSYFAERALSLERQQDRRPGAAGGP
jgi:hypothetical protein